jgi:squalene-hopene/tetraprenyl-beta-curcumene cyclase
VQKALLYLYSRQHNTSFWLPLWFGNPAAKGQTNPIYGTARVLLSLVGFSGPEASLVQKMLQAGEGWFLSAQKQDGSWSADGICESSVEETALAVGALATLRCCRGAIHNPPALEEAVKKGIVWLTEQKYTSDKSASIGLYFARLWYYERMYKLIFSVGALRLVRDFLR